MQSVKNSNFPIKDGFVRMTEMKGYYILDYIDREHTKVSYIVKANPGGSLPSSIVNSSSQDIPFETLKGIKRCATQKRYIDAAAKSEEKNKIEDAIVKGYLKK
jgi:hypothetical protein